MKELNVHISQIDKWVESRQIPDDIVLIRDYELRIDETKRKIASLITTDLSSDCKSELGLICYAMGVYTICGGVVYKWHRNGDTDLSTSLPLSKGNIWLDYLGDQTRIRELGGYIAVMLSDLGVKYLNGISKEVSSSYTTGVTVQSFYIPRSKQSTQ